MVLSCTGGRYRVAVTGEVVDASLRGRAKHGGGLKVLVGDRVTVARHADGHVTIERVEPRTSVLRRRMPGRARGVREIAANVDQVVVVGATRAPAWDPYQIDRFLAVAEANGLPALVVINKIDLEPAADRGGPYEGAGYAVLQTSTASGAGTSALRDRLAGHVSLFTGPTGVGKSSLLNAVQPGLGLRTAAVSARAQTGRHTTVAAEMHPLDAGGFVVDTPGLRDVGLWGLEPLEVVAAFPEIAERHGACRFDNCRHLEEPDCAVRSAVNEGIIIGSRYNSYRTMLEEAERAARFWE